MRENSTNQLFYTSHNTHTRGHSFKLLKPPAYHLVMTLPLIEVLNHARLETGCYRMRTVIHVLPLVQYQA